MIEILTKIASTLAMDERSICSNTIYDIYTVPIWETAGSARGVTIFSEVLGADLQKKV